MPRCPRCGQDNGEDARFCSRCGTRLSVATRRPPVRKAVTVVFTDVTGFTNLSERLDPERLRGVMSRYFQEMRGIAERHGGRVEKFIGDAVVAVFGVPRLHEDDALRAVRAAADMRDAVETLNQELEVDWGLTIQVRTGVNTGEVVAGDENGYEAIVLGDAVNVAARLQQAAAPQEVLLGGDTYRLVRGAIRAEQLEPLELKGKREPVAAYRLVHVSPGPVTRRLDAPMVGRRDELSKLRLAFEQAVTQRRCRRLTVLGPAGIGKSRLVAELTASLAPALVLEGHCLPYGDGITFWPLTEMVRHAADITDEDSADEATAKIRALVADEEDAGLIVERVGQAMGLVEGAAAPDEIFWAVRKLLEALAARVPVVVIFEDCHWAEPVFLNLVDDVLEWSRDAPILIVCLARPELLDQRPGWSGDTADAEVVRLEPLEPIDGEHVVANLLGGSGVDPWAVRQIVRTAEGNPLFIEELVAMLVDEGLLRRDNGGWVPRGDGSYEKLPLSLQTLLATRLDRLPPQDRQVVELASVVGTEFYRDAISELLPEPARPELATSLVTLVDRELIRPAPSGFRQDAFRFHHGLMRDAAYNGLSKEARAQLHERVAAWIERTAETGEYEEILGYHLEQAYRYRTELRPLDDAARALAQRAAEQLAGAGRRALARGDVLAASKLLSRAVALLPRDSDLRLSLLPELSEALMGTGELERANAFLDDAMEAAVASGNVPLQKHLSLARAMQLLFTDQTGGAAAALAAGEEAISLFESVGDEVGLARAWRVVSIVHLACARFSAAEEAMDRAALHAHNAGARREELDSLFWLPLPLWAGPATPEAGLHRLDEILQRAGGDPKVEATILFIRGGFEAMSGRFPAARALVAKSKEALEDLGLRLWLAGPWAQVKGWVELLAGDPVAAERELRAGLAALEQMGETGLASTVTALLAASLLEQDRLDEADRLSRLSAEMAAPSDTYTQVLVRSVGARTYAKRGRLEEAEALAREAVQLTEESDFLQIRGDALSTLAEVLQSAGRREEAGAALQAALDVYRRKGNVVSAGRAGSRLEELGWLG